MISRLPLDSGLPGLPALLDETTVIAMVSAHLGRSDQFDLIGCRPHYIRYKPETTCLVQYDLVVHNEVGEPISISAHLKTFADDRALRKADSGSMHRLLDWASRLQQDLPFQRLAYLPEVNGLLQIYPVDADLRFLVRAADAGRTTAVLRKNLVDFKRTKVVSAPELIRYKPERKALLRYQLCDGPVARLYGKVHSEHRAERLAMQASTLIEAGVATPAVIVSVPRRRFVAHAEAPGVPLASLRGGQAYKAWMEPLAGALGQLQTVELPESPVFDLAHIAAEIAETSRWLARIAPHLTDRLNTLSDDICARLAGTDPLMTTCHGDFYDDQAIVSESGLALIDLDEVRISHPLFDVGNMLAHLSVAASGGEAVEGAREAFLEPVLRRGHFAKRDVALFEALAVLRLAPGPFRRLEHDWLEGIERIVGLSESVLSRAERRGRAVPTKGAHGPTNGEVVDASLPQLRTLQDRVAMSARLTDIAGETVSVTGIEMVRHKMGRRAILRYELERGDRRDRVYGKTFASDRGPNVHQIVERIAKAAAFGSDVAVPDPVAYFPDLKLLTQRSVTGEPVERALLAGDGDVASRIAELLYRFHTSGLDLERRHDLARELEPLPMRVEQVRALSADLGNLAGSCLDRIREVSSPDAFWRYRPVHRDFYHDQLLIAGGRLAVLDLDDAAMSEPALDVANFAAHLILLGVRKPGNETPLTDVERVFVDQYRALDADFNPELMRYLTATTLVRLAGIHGSREDGQRVAREMLQRAESLLSRLNS